MSQMVIKGVTRTGRRFRPSDWAERLTTAVGSVGLDRRVRFHPKVHMANIGGVNCVVVEQELASSEPLLWGFLVSFAKDNELLVEGLEERPPPG